MSHAVSRRTFLRQGAGAAGLAGLTLTTGLPVRAAAPSATVTLGCIGLGGMGSALLGSFLGMGDARVLAVCDVDRQTAEQKRDTVNQRYDNTDCTCYTDFRDVIERKDIDAVVIATPDHWHAVPAILAAEAGKDIYCEKPMTHDLREGRAVCDAVQQHGVIWQTGSWQRSLNHFRFACELVRNGYIGKVRHIEVGLPDGGDGPVVGDFPPSPEWLDYDFWVGPAPYVPYHPQRCKGNWRWWLGFGGGQLMDWVGHHGDIAHMGMGWDRTGPLEIEPLHWSVPAASNLYDAATDYEYVCTYEGGVTMHVANMRRMPEVFSQYGDTGTQFFGDDDRYVWVGRSGLHTSPAELGSISLSGNDLRLTVSPGHQHEFIASVKTRRPCLAHEEAGHRSASIGHLGMVACRLGTRLHWDPVNEQVVDSPTAERLLGRAYRAPWTL